MAQTGGFISTRGHSPTQKRVSLAQQVERAAFNGKVAGSNPSGYQKDAVGPDTHAVVILLRRVHGAHSGRTPHRGSNPSADMRVAEIAGHIQTRINAPTAGTCSRFGSPPCSPTLWRGCAVSWTQKANAAAAQNAREFDKTRRSSRSTSATRALAEGLSINTSGFLAHFLFFPKRKLRLAPRPKIQKDGTKV